MLLAGATKRRDVFQLALLSRCLILLLQAVANLLPDHNADAFKPIVPNSTNMADSLLRAALDGLDKWDSKHILHVAENGYVTEDSFAFFPLFPFIIRGVANLLASLLPFLTLHTCCVVSAVCFNTIVFTGAATSLFDLTASLFNNPIFAFLTSLSFCFNPASIFFSACYTESLYSFCVFTALKHLYRQLRRLNGASPDFFYHFKATVWFMLASLCRANGAINCGFIAYSYMWYLVANWTRKRNIYQAVTCLVQCVLFCIAIVLPFLLFNFYGYMKFCTICVGLDDCSATPSWCLDWFPSIYNHIQESTWGLGLFAYYKFRKIPNFLLAFPIIYLSIYSSVLYVFRRREECLFLGFPFSIASKKSKTKKSKTLMFSSINLCCFFVHLLFLVVFAVLFMHIEVTTRMVLSSTPLIYWVVASYFYKDLFTSNAPLFSHKTWNRLSPGSKTLASYFVSYLVLGTVLHSNFLPWT